jgi:hypothetical protein
VFGDAFPPDDQLSEWLVTLALAMNDLSLVHDRLEVDQDKPERAFYWNRVALSHFTEAALFLYDTREIPEVKDFVGSLDEEARRKYDECLTVFSERRARLFDTRNKATFHYPALRPNAPQAERPVRDALEELRGERGIIRSARIRDARALFADDVVATIFSRQVGGVDAVKGFEARVAEGTTAYIRFANLALDEYLMRARASGLEITEVLPVDPEDLRRGWKIVEPGLANE